MAGSLTRAFQQTVLNNIVRKSTADLTGSTWWIHLFNSTLTDAATPASTGRCVGTGYTPKKITNSTASWVAPTAASPSATENKNVITFTTAAGANWGTIKAVLITSSSGTGGNGYWWMDVTPNQAVSTGNTVQISTGAIDLTLT